MESGFWLGLVVAVPLSILANMLTRPVQNRLDSRIRSRALRRTSNMQHDYEKAKHYKDHREEFYEFMLDSIIALVGLLFPLICLLAALLVLFETDPFKNASEPVQLTSVTVNVLSIGICMIMAKRERDRALKIAYRVRNFSEYESRVKPELDSELQK